MSQISMFLLDCKLIYIQKNNVFEFDKTSQQKLLYLKCIGTLNLILNYMLKIISNVNNICA